MSFIVAISSLIGFVFLGARFVAEVITPSRSKHKQRSIPPCEVMNRIVSMHSDCTAEILDVAIIDRKYASMSYSLPVGTVLRLELKGTTVIEVYASDDICVTTLTPPVSSNIINALQAGSPIFAYLGGRDMNNSSPMSDFISIIVFYQLPGLSPTTVILQ